MWGDGGAYAVWVGYLKRWGADLRTADEPLPALQQQDFAPETWVRLTNHIVDAVNGRLRAWTEAFVADVSSARSEFAYGRGLVSARTGLTSVLRLVDNPALPADLREQLRGQVERQVTSMQQSLEKEVAELERQGWSRAEAETRRRSVRDNPLTADLTAPPAPAQPAAVLPPDAPDPWAQDLTGRPRRRLVID